MSDNKNEKQADYERGQEAGSQAGFYEKTLHSYERAFQSDAYNAGFKNGVANQPQSTIYDAPISTREEPKTTVRPKEESTQSSSGGYSNWEYSSSQESVGGLKMVIICIGIIIVAVVGWRFFQDVAEKQSQPQPQEKIVFVPRPPDVLENKIIFHTQWGDVETKNFYKTAIREVGDYLSISETDEYQSSYDKKNSLFIISLTSKPINTARKNAENDLLNILGISKQEACKLNIIIGITAQADPQNAGTNFPLSFCPSN